MATWLSEENTQLKLNLEYVKHEYEGYNDAEETRQMLQVKLEEQEREFNDKMTKLKAKHKTKLETMAAKFQSVLDIKLEEN